MKLRNVFLLAVVMSIATFAQNFKSNNNFSSITVTGDVSGTWDADTVFVTGDISIPLDSTLNILPGTNVYFTDEYKFDVFGTLSASGTETDSVFFFSDSLGEISSWPYYKGFWYGITFHSTDENGQTPSALDYCNFKYAYPSWLDEMSNRYGGGLIYYKSQINLSHSSFTDCLDDDLTRGVFTAINSNGVVKEVSFYKVSSYRAGTLTLLNSDVVIENLNMNDAYGVYLESSTAEINNSKFINNTPYIQWGIINAVNSEVTLSDCIITDNFGIGILSKNSEFIVEYTLIKNNSQEGGRFEESPSTFVNCEILENGSYGLLFRTYQNWGTTFTSEIRNCLIAKNNDTGILFQSLNNADIINCTIADNYSSTAWGGIKNGDVDTHLKNCIVYNNGNDFDYQAGGLYTYSIVQGNYVGSDTATTNFQNVDPLFRDAANGDYHLQSTSCGFGSDSPGIDAGDPTITDMIVDCASAGLLTKLSDIGAYGGNDNWWDRTILRDCHYMGDVSGLWECDTIFVDGNITIPEGDTLQIKGSVKKVLFTGKYDLTVNGVLLAVGDEGSYIVFEGSNVQGEQWEGISFDNLNDSGVGSSIIKNCRFNRSRRLSHGGAIYINNSDNILIERSMFYQNGAFAGGAIYIEDSNPEITDCYFNENGFYETSVYSAGGGAVYLKNSNPVMHKLQFVNNHSYTSGGAILFDNSSPVLTNILAVRNITLGDNGGAISCVNNSNPKFVNLTCADNVSGEAGGAFGLGTGSNPVIINSILYGNTKPEIWILNSSFNATYSIVESASSESYFGTGCLDVSPEFKMTDENLFYLSSTACGNDITSPAIDAGHPDSLDAVLNCAEGLGTYRADMGFYGGRYSEMPVGVGNSGAGETPKQFSLYQNYPNPFNPTTTIKYTIGVVETQCIASLRVYNILGEEVATLVNKQQPAGNYSITFNASALPSGVYFYRLQAGNFVATKKMILMK